MKMREIRRPEVVPVASADSLRLPDSCGCARGADYGELPRSFVPLASPSLEELFDVFPDNELLNATGGVYVY